MLLFHSEAAAQHAIIHAHFTQGRYISLTVHFTVHVLYFGVLLRVLNLKHVFQ